MKGVLWQPCPCQPELEGSTQQVPGLRGEVMWDTPCPLAHAPCPGQPVRMCSHAAVLGRHGPWGLVPALSWLPEGHPLASALAGCPLGAPSRPQLAGQASSVGLRGGPKIAAGLAQGWHAEHMRDRACPGGRACLCWPGLQVSADPCSLERNSGGGRSRGPPRDPRTHRCLL